MEQPKVCIIHNPTAQYPTENFNPSVYYPEYPFGEEEINSAENKVYEMVRESLCRLGLDSEHYGTKEWNPLKDYVKPGQKVLIKPNLVMHENENKKVYENAMECLVTHPSCIRAICDYCVIALGNAGGTILIADAPMQGCDFDALIKKMHIDSLLDFYKQKGLDVRLKDLRQYQSVFNSQRVITEKRFTDSHGIIVSLGGKSAHIGSPSNQQYQVSDYEKKDTQHFHHDSVHDYELSADILQADCIINFCKPKTHRLAGFTAAMKNMVGATYNKASLPHRSAGSVKEGGDAYQQKNVLKRLADFALTQKIRAENKHNIVFATFLRYVYGISLVTARKFGKDTFYIGSWYGNDTIWRTVCDLNYAVTYADKNGKLCDTPQRKMLNFGDMVISGERNGPVSPQPKKMGVIIASDNSAAFDMTLCKMMHFDFDKIPMCRNLKSGSTNIPFTDPCVIFTDGETVNEDILSKISFPAEWRFVPHDAWKDVL